MLAGKTMNQRDDVVVFAVQVFGNRENALGWLKGARVDDGRTLWSMLDSEDGIREVYEMLVRIDEGIYS
jgi:uncharacterized protein (DUF2384 family)